MGRIMLKRGDEVQVTSGADKGKKGKVLKLLTAQNKVIVEGVGIVKRHLKPTAAKPQGGIEEKESPITVSNVAFLDPKSSKPTKLGYRFLKDKRKVRYAKLSKESLD